MLPAEPTERRSWRKASDLAGLRFESCGLSRHLQHREHVLFHSLRTSHFRKRVPRHVTAIISAVQQIQLDRSMLAAAFDRREPATAQPRTATVKSQTDSAIPYCSFGDMCVFASNGRLFFRPLIPISLVISIFMRTVVLQQWCFSSLVFLRSLPSS